MGDRIRAALQLIIAAGFIVGASLAVAWLIKTKPSAPQSARSEPIYAVRSLRAEAKTHQPMISVFGEVTARRSVELRALVAGPVVEASDNLIVGGRVAARELLVRIDPFSYEGAVDEARANLEEAKASLAEAQAQRDAWEQDFLRLKEQVAIAERDLKRAESLAGANNVAERTVDERRLVLVQRRQAVEAAETNRLVQDARVTRQQATVDRLEWRLRQAERDLRDTQLRAPFEAVVRSENVGVGKRLGANDLVAQLYEAEALDLRFTLADSQFGRLNGGGEALIGRRAEVSWAVGDAPNKAGATVDRIGPDVSPLTGGVQVLARLEPKAAALGLRPGAFVTVSLPDQGFAQSYRLPEEALYNDAYVFVLKAEDCEISSPKSGVDKATETKTARLLRVQVQPLAWDASDVLVRGELAGEEVLASRLAEAGDGVKVRVIERTSAEVVKQGADQAGAPIASGRKG